jgi:hypothetical protein
MEAMQGGLGVVAIGVGATAVMDAWMMVRARAFGVPAPDYGLVGRWIGHMPRGRFRHDRIAAAGPIRHERLLGWAVHYLTGIVFATVLFMLAGPGWLKQPSIGIALAIGFGTVAFPFLLMQPGMGAGVAASRAPRPWNARLQSVITHAVFGFGLYASAVPLVPFHN